MELRPANPPEVTLGELEDFLKSFMESLGPELRYYARMLPVKIKYNYYDNDFVITNINAVKKSMVVTIDPVF